MLRAALTPAAAHRRRSRSASRTARASLPSLAGVDLVALRAAVAADHAIADAAHDVSHLDRVAELAGWIARRLGVDPTLARIAAYVHDYHRVAEARTGVRPLPADAANDLVRAVLQEHGVPRRHVPAVLCAVDATGRYRIAGDALPSDLARACPVAAIVHDADNLDALGVVGLARAVSYGAVLGEPLWEPHAAIRATYADGLSSSVLAHCYEKLVHLADEMLTAPARALARRRLADLYGVLGRLRAELAAPVAPAWDPRTGYLRVVLDGAADPDSRLTFQARARIGLRRGLACFLELSGVPALARAALTGTDDGTLRVAVGSGGVADGVAAGDAVVELELAAGRVAAVTLHLTVPALDDVGMIAG